MHAWASWLLSGRGDPNELVYPPGYCSKFLAGLRDGLAAVGTSAADASGSGTASRVSRHGAAIGIQEFQPTWRELVRRLSVHRPSLNCRAGRVDIDERENLRLASEEGVLGSGVPSIALYGGRGAAAAIVWAYDATRDDLESSFPSAAELEGAVAARCREDE
ncbi:unnamed protein product, partial [Prorocentrum cordatum]